MVFWPDFIWNIYVCRKCSLLFLGIFFFKLNFYLMSCFLNFDKCINAVEKMPVRPSVIEKSHKQKIRIDFKVFFSLLHIWEERHQKNDHITVYVVSYCCPSSTVVYMYVNNDWENYKPYVISDWFLVIFRELLLISSIREIQFLMVFSCNEH